MAETLPAEAPYTLRDILELLNYRVRLAKYEVRSQSVIKPIYSDQPGRSATTQAHSAMMWSALNYPQPGRLTEERAPTLPLYRRLLKTARRDYESDLDSTLLPVILSDVIAGTSKTLNETWDMIAEDFDRFWTESQKLSLVAPPQAAIAAPAMTLGKFFDTLAQIEKDSNPTGPFSTDSNGNPSDPSQEAYARIQYYVLLESQKLAIKATQGYEAFRTYLLLEFGLPPVSESRHKVVLELLKRGVVGTIHEAEALPLEAVEGRCNRMKRKIPLPIGFPPRILHWLEARYLSSAQPCECDSPSMIGIPVVLELMDSFTAFLLSNEFPVTQTLTALKNALLIEDLRVDISESEMLNDSAPHAQALLRLKLDPGIYRLLAICNDVVRLSEQSASHREVVPPEVVHDLDLLRTEVAALHIPGTSRKADGESVSKIINEPGLLDRIAHHGKRTDRESLARFLQSCLQPKKKPDDDIA